jgi:hypothetical protein
MHDVTPAPPAAPAALPRFAYHPDPVATGAFERSEAACQCCGRARGWTYACNVYTTHDVGPVCPWCVADGSAAARWDARFGDTFELHEAGVPAPVIDEVERRTPGWRSWQGEQWLAHCGDACAFHGDASAEDVARASEATRADWIAHYRQDEATWRWVTEGYAPGGDSALYRFVCRHCGLVRFGWDLS